MELYNSKKQAELNEGTIYGIDDSIYETIEEAEADFPDGEVFAWFDENDRIRVGWTA
jgi:hypothetical protein